MTEAEIKEIVDMCSQRIRKKKKKDGYMVGWKEIFTEENKVLFKKYFGKLLVDLGYEKNYNW